VRLKLLPAKLNPPTSAFSLPLSGSSETSVACARRSHTVSVTFKFHRHRAL